MKKILSYALLITTLACKQSPSDKSKTTNSSDVTVQNDQTICSLIVSEVLVNDTPNISYTGGELDQAGKWIPTETSVSYSQNNGFNQEQIKNLKEILVKDTAIKVLRNLNSEPVSKQEARMFLHCCDSIPEMDGTGNPTGKVQLMCDSTNLERELRKIIFYESMYFNRDKNTYEKRILGYTFLFFKADKSQGEMYHIFMNEKALSTVKEKLSIQSKKKQS